MITTVNQVTSASLNNKFVRKSLPNDDVFTQKIQYVIKDVL